MRHVIRVALLVALTVAYFASMRVCAGLPVVWHILFAIESPMFPFIQYLWWLPFGIAAFLVIRKSLMWSRLVRALVFAIIFAPGLMGLYRILWFAPAFQVGTILWQDRSPGTVMWVAVFGAAPLLIVWLLAYFAMLLVQVASTTVS
jgi:hypothetical protein